MKKICLMIIILTSTLQFYGQNWLWAKRYGEASNYLTENATVDIPGNSFVILHYYHDLKIGGVTYRWCGNPGSLLVKYDSSGNVQWGRRLFSFAYGVSTDHEGNCYVSGQARRPHPYFENGTGGLDTLSLTGYSDAFIAKYSTTGTLEWIRSYSTGDQGDNGYDVKTDPFGNAILLVNTHKDYVSKFAVVKYDPSGNLLWNLQTKWGLNDAQKMAIDGTSSIYIVGGAVQSTQIGNDTIFGSYEDPKMFLAKISPSGRIKWIDIAIGSYVPMDLKVSQKGTILITGEANYLPTTFDPFSVVSANRNFIAKYDTDGNFMWTKSFWLSDTRVSMDNDDNIFLAGSYYDTAQFYEEEITIPRDPYRHFLIAKYASDGTLNSIYKSQNNSKGLVLTRSIDKDPFGNFIITGSFTDSIDFGGIPVVCPHITDPLDYNLFIAKFSPDGMGTVTGLPVKNVKDVKDIFSVDPNPATGLLNIFYSNKNTKKTLTLSIKNILDETIFNKTYPSSTTQFQESIDLNKISKGVYFIELDNGKEKEKKKIVLN